ncbi:hypothetical protein SARC_01398 [Sphaeroforma arctica JP610]|uniref:Complex 1 LYR protein domain-containing protein n=1 Tax=Sphaeroforma arctica JP610 TaxID=667725 RepID=A0A0L0GBQ0_9EUKA|nr:hypothetical protein SARC_01398 [Sphaeroforma arctica JP610]KNC86442.1 hypothetical protein SARC_01398 [Sphaeroforma arctica JP610]|eukprot:XP_014160344.1 hypothetical protein SARC_01398 [Sphaeroforma arctica JP610]
MHLMHLKPHTAFRQEIRGHFEKNRNETDEKKLKKMLKQSVDLEKMVRMNLVQGKQTGVDNTIGQLCCWNVHDIITCLI